jgi:L-ascorbate metabolism protein UlaG (beta-lactamase superfamily)
MATNSMSIDRDKINAIARKAAIGFAGVVIVVFVVAAALWGDRPQLGEIDWQPYPVYESRADAVTVTWLGVTTLLFDDGNTQILIDGFFSRPSLADIVFSTKVQSNAAQINRVMDEYRMRRLAAIIPVHSHFDHAMDIGAIANRSSASIIGSESTANIARGSGVPEDQIVVAENGSKYDFGDFSVRIIPSRHAPLGWGGSVPYAGSIDEPLDLPAPVSAWREGQSFSIVVAHPEGTTLIQGSAGFLPGTLDDVVADVVMLGAFGLENFGHKYTEQYWLSLVTSTGAKRVLPIHFDDYTRPFGHIELGPRIFDNFVDSAEWLDAIRETWDNDARLHLPVFGEKLVLYPPSIPDA